MREYALSNAEANEATSTILAAVGQALNNWSIVELQMTTLFDILADMRNNSKARALFESVISFEVRLAMLNKMMAFEDLETEDARIWKKLSSKLTKTYKKRHEVAHFTILASGETVHISPFLTWEAFHADTHRLLSKDEILARGDKFIELAAAINWFRDQAIVRRSRGELSTEILREPPPLVAQLRSAVQADATPQE